jgi:hypothetical protein
MSNEDEEKKLLIKNNSDNNSRIFLNNTYSNNISNLNFNNNNNQPLPENVFSDQEPVTEEHVNKKFSNNFCSFLIGYLVVIIWYVLFHSFTTNESHFNNDKVCVFLLQTTKGLTNFYYTFLIAMTIMFVYSFCEGKNNFLDSFIGFCFLLFCLYALLNIVVYLISMTSSLNKGERCGDLRTLSMVWIIVNYVMVVGLCCTTCCGIVFCSLGIWATQTTRRN